MYWAREAIGNWMFLYFNVITFFSYFLLNLIVVLIIVNYSLSQEQSAVQSIKDGNMVDTVRPDGNLIVKPNGMTVARLPVTID